MASPLHHHRRWAVRRKNIMKTGIAKVAAGLSLAAAGVLATTAQAQVLDQVQDNIGATFNVESLNWQQEITVGVAGQLTQIDFFVSTPGAATFYVGDGAPWQEEPYGFVLDFVTEETGWHAIDISSAGMEFEVGDGMALGLAGIGSTLWIGGGYEPPDGPYPGELWVNGMVYPIPGWDFAFRTWMLPGPGSLAMIGLAGLMMPRRRRA
jgi:hypothetical protein